MGSQMLKAFTTEGTDEHRVKPLIKGPARRPTRQFTPCAGQRALGGASSILEVRGVLLDERFLIFGDIILGKNRIRGAGRDASAAVDALRRVDKKLRGGFEAGLAVFGMNAIGGADIDAERILDAVAGNYVGHDESPSMKPDCLLDFEFRDEEDAWP